MEEIREAYKAKKEEMIEKYKVEIKAIAEKNHVDMGIGFDMLKAVARVEIEPGLKEDEHYIDYAEGIEINKEELAKDYKELEELSQKILGAFPIE